jgi:GNAT superfamily N-acetyltransferase
MSLPLDTIGMAEPDLDAAAVIQARAFFDDPLFEFVFPDETVRRVHLPSIMRIGLSAGLHVGHVHTTRSTMLGHAVWLPPGSTHMSDDRLGEAGFADVEHPMDESALARFGTFMQQSSAIHDRLMPGPHWYLMILGVDPPYQGRGIGGALMAPTLARADEAGLPCYLETAKQRNVVYYRKHGFEVAEEQTVAGDGPPVWMMIRQPR